MERLLNIIGLVIGLIGTYLMYHFSSKINSKTILYQRKEMEDVAKKDLLKNRMIRLGMILLVVSFLCQALALFGKFN